MRITKSFINLNRTKNGGWTKRQLEIIGIPWLPQKGWIQKAIQNSIDEKQKKEFELIALKTFANN